MPITDLLERNSKLYGDETALVEINPEIQEEQRVTWKEYALIQPTATAPYRREITWSVFDEKANRVANMLLGRGIRKGQKVAILLMNCLEWLPIYFGILKAGAIAVPLNFRYTSGEIDYCLRLADADVLFFGPEFIGRVEEIVPKISHQMLLLFVGEGSPSFAEDYLRATANCSAPVPHRGENALVWLPVHREQGRAAEGELPPGHLPGRQPGAVYHRLAAGALVPGHPGRPGPGGLEP